MQAHSRIILQRIAKYEPCSGMAIRSPEDRLRRAASFNESAELYDRARPRYPAEIFDRLWEMARLGPEPEIIEVGCGTGQASLSLAERGARLICIELGENMAALARRNLSTYPSARVIVSKFEEWDPDGATFDLLFASASWHWVQPEIRYQRAAAALRSGGHVAIVHSDHVYPEGFDPLYGPIQEVYREVTGSSKEVRVQEIPAPGVFDAKDQEHIAEIGRVGVFAETSIVRVLWNYERTADEYIDLLSTYSDHWALEPEKRARLFEGIHGIISQGPTGLVRKHYLTTLRVSRRV